MFVFVSLSSHSYVCHFVYVLWLLLTGNICSRLRLRLRFRMVFLVVVIRVRLRVCIRVRGSFPLPAVVDIIDIVLSFVSTHSPSSVDVLRGVPSSSQHMVFVRCYSCV